MSSTMRGKPVHSVPNLNEFDTLTLLYTHLEMYRILDSEYLLTPHRFVVPTLDVHFNVMRYAHRVLRNALGFANTKGSVVCLAPRHVIAFHATNAAPKTCLADTSALDYVARLAPRAIAKIVPSTEKLELTYLR